MRLDTASGVGFEVRTVSNFAIKRIQDGFLPDKPAVPKVHVAEDDRWVEVPEDPAYQSAYQAWQAKVVEGTYDALVVLGTSLVHVPEGMDRPEDPGWAADLELVGIPVAASGKARYLAWVKYYACHDNQDMVALINAINRAVGVPEEDAAKAAAAFRGGA